MKQPVTKIAKSFSNAAQRWPVSWLELECGHTASPVLREEPNDRIRYGTAFEHDDANHLAKPGDRVQCDACDHYQAALAKLRAMKPGDVQHSRFRHRDSRGFGPGDLYVYGRNERSPTGVTLIMSIDDTPEAAEILRMLCASPLSPTEPR